MRSWLDPLKIAQVDIISYEPVFLCALYVLNGRILYAIVFIMNS